PVIERAPLPRLEVTQPDRAVAHAPQSLHVMAELGEHAPHLALPAFLQRKHDSLSTPAPHRACTRASVVELYAATQLLERSIVDLLLQLDIVLAIDPVARVQQAVRGIAIVRKQYQPLAVEVQATYVKEPPHGRRHQVVERAPAFRVAARAHV